MSVNNLHSLINGRWFIHEQYGHSLLPSLFSILEGKDVSIKTAKKETDVFVSLKNSNGIVANSSFDSSNNKVDYVAIINLKDPIYKYDQECGPRGTKSKMRAMQNFEKDTNCIGIVLDIDSGGGQVSGTPEFYDFVKNYSKPVVAYTDGYMCSAAYYIGSSASYIIANKRADHIGSIGTMVYFIDFTGMYEKKGAKVISEYSTLSTEKNKAFEELVAGKPELYITTQLDPITETFIEDIKSVRPGVDKTVYTGGTWNADESLSKNLIDEIGSLQDAVNKVFDLSKSSNSNKNNNNSNKKTMSKKTKSFPVLQGILGIKEEGIATISTITGKSGVQLTEAHLEALETALVAKDSAVTAANGKVTTANGTVTELETATTAALATAKLEAGATTAESIALLGAKVVELGKKPSGKTSTADAKGDSFEEGDSAIVKADDDHNKLYNDL